MSESVTFQRALLLIVGHALLWSSLAVIATTMVVIVIGGLVWLWFQYWPLALFGTVSMAAIVGMVLIDLAHTLAVKHPDTED